MIAQALAEQGMDVIPEDLQPAEVWPCAQPYRDAFVVLSAARPAGGMGGPAAIPYPDILAYAGANGLADTTLDLEDCVRLVQAQDHVYLTHHASKKER